MSFTHHDPLEDTEREIDLMRWSISYLRFTHHDPLEDTEREKTLGDGWRVEVFHPSRSA